jgi:hypothetical protein
MSQNQVDLASLFGAVTQALAENQEPLNNADAYNHNHGTNMVQTFATITQALQQKQDRTNSTALRYAAKQVAEKSSSGSGQLYAQHLKRAASQVKGKELDSQQAVKLLQSLIGSPPARKKAQQPAATDLFGSLMGGLTGDGGTGSSEQSGFGLENLLSAGMAYVQAKQSGSSPMQALTQAFMTGSGMGGDPHRSQSTEVVVNSFLQALSSMSSR